MLEVIGLMMLSVCSEYYQLFLCHGIAVGLGAGITFTPSVAAASACLRGPATRAKAMGVMACGSSIGMFNRQRGLYLQVSLTNYH